MAGSIAGRGRPSRVLIVAEHPVLRGVVRMACEASDRVVVVGEAATGGTALDAVAADRPDVIVLDTTLPDMRGPDAIRRARDARPDVRVLALVNHADDRTVFDLIRSGADGCLEKTAGASRLGASIEAIAAGGRVFSAEQERAAIEQLGRLARHAREASAVAAAVTPRELEILRYASHGLTMRQVASRLGVSPRTVEAHIAKVYRKLGVTNRVRAIGRATELGLIQLEP